MHIKRNNFIIFLIIFQLLWSLSYKLPNQRVWNSISNQFWGVFGLALVYKMFYISFFAYCFFIHCQHFQPCDFFNYFCIFLPISERISISKYIGIQPLYIFSFVLYLTLIHFGNNILSIFKINNLYIFYLKKKFSITILV